MKKILWVFCIYAVVNGCPPDWLNLGFEGCFHFASEVSPYAYGLNYYQSQEYLSNLFVNTFKRLRLIFIELTLDYSFGSPIQRCYQNLEWADTYPSIFCS